MMEDTEERQCLVSAQSEENVASSESQESHESSEERSKRTEEVGAGWYAWLVVCCSFTCVCVLDGIGYSFGVFFETLLRDLSGGQGRGVLSIAGGLQVRNSLYPRRIRRREKFTLAPNCSFLFKL